MLTYRPLGSRNSFQLPASYRLKTPKRTPYTPWQTLLFSGDDLLGTYSGMVRTESRNRAIEAAFKHWQAGLAKAKAEKEAQLLADALEAGAAPAEEGELGDLLARRHSLKADSACSQTVRVGDTVWLLREDYTQTPMVVGPCLVAAHETRGMVARNEEVDFCVFLRQDSLVYYNPAAAKKALLVKLEAYRTYHSEMVAICNLRIAELGGV